MPTYIKWPEPVGATRLEYKPEVLEQLRLLAIDGLLALPKVGIAIGGLLTGSVEQGKVRVSGAIEIPCSHANGPAFFLTGAELARASAQAFGQSEQQVVGWYCSKPRGELVLEEQQAMVFSEICPEGWQIGLLIRPSTVEPTRARICTRVAGSGYIAGRPMELIEYTPPRHVAVEGLEEAVLPLAVADTQEAKPAIPVVHTPVVHTVRTPDFTTLPAFATVESGKSGSSRAKRLFVAVAAGLALVSILYAYRWDIIPRPPLAVTVTEESGQVTIRWNPQALAGIDEASIALNDGGQLQTIRLDERVLVSGWIRAQRKSDRVTAKLTAGEISGLGAWNATPRAEPVRTPDAVAPAQGVPPPPARGLTSPSDGPR